MSFFTELSLVQCTLYNCTLYIRRRNYAKMDSMLQSSLSKRQDTDQEKVIDIPKEDIPYQNSAMSDTSRSKILHVWKQLFVLFNFLKQRITVKRYLHFGCIGKSLHFNRISDIFQNLSKKSLEQFISRFATVCSKFLSSLYCSVECW
jgi:hypothetical protein